MLTFDRAMEILSEYGSDSPWKTHCIAVARLASRFAEIFSAGQTIDREFLVTAALLHDIGRYRTHDPYMHGAEGYRLLSDLGYKRHAHVCASHVLFGLTRSEAVRCGLPDRDFMPVTFEEQLVPVLDSLVELDRPTTLEQRVTSIRTRYRGDKVFLGRLEDAAAKVRIFISQANADFDISMEEIAAETLSAQEQIHAQ